MTERIKVMALTATAIAAAAALAEISVRAYQRLVHGIGFLSVFPDYRLEPMTYSPFLAFGPRVHYEVPGKRYPELSRFDARGFRSVTPSHVVRPAELRIVTLGGSTTEDLWNDSGRHWPWWLERLLDSTTASPVRVLNGGMSAYATPHSLIRTAFDVADVEADVLLVMHNINDLTVVYHAITHGTPVDGHYATKYLQRSYTGVRGERDVVWSRLARLLRQAIAPSPGAPEQLPEDPEKLAEGIRLFVRNLSSIAAVARAHGIRPIFLTMPFSRGEAQFRAMQSGQIRVGSVGVGRLPTLERLFEDLERYNAAVRGMCAQAGVTVIDLADSGPWEDAHFVDIVHLTDQGSEEFARRLAPRLAVALAGDSPCETRIQHAR